MSRYEQRVLFEMAKQVKMLTKQIEHLTKLVEASNIANAPMEERINQQADSRDFHPELFVRKGR